MYTHAQKKIYFFIIEKEFKEASVYDSSLHAQHYSLKDWS